MAVTVVPLPGAETMVEPPAIEHGPLVHAHQTEVALAREIGRLIGRHETPTVVADDQRERLRREIRGEIHVGRRGVRRHVVQRLLDDAKGRQLQVRSEPHRLASDGHLDRQLTTFRRLPGQHLDGRDEAQIFQVDRAQVADELPQRVQFPVNQSFQLRQARVGARWVGGD